MNTYFKVGDRSFESRDAAIKQINDWKAITTTLSVHEVQNAEVTRKTAKGAIITERVRGSLDRVPRVISVRNLDPTYIVVTSDDNPGSWPSNSYDYNSRTAYSTRAEAEQERAERRARVKSLAALTDADIKEVHVPTLADILERDAAKIEGLEAEIENYLQQLAKLEEQAKASISVEVANLESQIAAVAASLQNQVAALKTKAAQEFGLQQAEEALNAAVKAHNEAIHYDEFAQQIMETLCEQHDCWPDSDCRVRGAYRGELTCTYEPDEVEIEQYLLENAEEFEVEEELVAAAAASPGTKLVHEKKNDPDVCEVAECTRTGCLICMACGIKLCAGHVGESQHPCKEWRKLDHYMAA